MKKLINLWPSIKHKNKFHIKIILHYHYKRIKINIKRSNLKTSKTVFRKLSRVLFRNFNYLKTIYYLKQVILLRNKLLIIKIENQISI